MIPQFRSIRVIAFEAQVRHADEAVWLTVCVSRRWSEIERALERAARSVNPVGRPAVEARVVTVDHSASAGTPAAF